MQRESVSIHAPLRGATTRRRPHYPFPPVSIHAPLRGATLTRCLIHCLIRFQSTHPCGVRPTRPILARPHSRFNPRTPAGCDSMDCDFVDDEGVSIHAPLRGATTSDLTVITSPVFQSTHPCGVRQGRLLQYLPEFLVSIHAPLRGATLKIDRYHGRIAVSIHAPLRGAT